MGEKQTTFETPDSFLAAFLLAKRRTIVAIRMDVKQRGGAWFVFEDLYQRIGGPSGLEREYLADGLVPARTACRYLKRLHRCIREQAERGSTLDRQALAAFFPSSARKKRRRRMTGGLKLRMLLLLCAPLFGDDRDARLLWASGIVGRPVSSFRQLLSAEGDQLLLLLLGEAEKEMGARTKRAPQCDVAQRTPAGVESGQSPPVEHSS
ncbi:hypothetical protein SBA5_750002 [Candidatus Sulfotelmatomonas gaucii]|uniref:Uncharacterized protein n=1 Tax=Candidatus Sulfuritelmatomonas gaucii TaxID=2043161 RepID=A0A2N9M3T3_9BACT|nr:hypothetical protein SBA5_750002 [Candidatus Sulfotelmatomonas gaucii]